MAWSLKGLSGVDEQALELQVAELASLTGLSRLTARVCVLRGLGTVPLIKAFLEPKLSELKDPMTIKDMDLALSRLASAREAKQKIRIFGDYDVDGTTGAALLGLFFTETGFNVDIRQPDRFKDGYGLGVQAVEAAHAEGIDLMVTVDCGISSFAAITRARELGLDVIVVDHHQIDPVKGIPDAYAVLDPQRLDCQSGLKELCGCGLAFYLCRAMKRLGVERGWWSLEQSPELKHHLDLVVIATAADMVPLIGDNHIMMRHGWSVLKHSKKAGVRALLSAAKVQFKELRPSHLGFTLGPRINASGRLGTATLALDLLMSNDQAKADQMALTLEKMNEERAQIQDQIWGEVKTQIDSGMTSGKFKNGIVVASEHWHEGVVGIVASRVVENYKRPAIVLSIKGEHCKGSVRTFGGKDVLEALRASSEFLLGFGGHRHAAGVSLLPKNIAAFQEAFDRACEDLVVDTKQANLQIEGSCEISELSVGALQELERLGPFGPGNPEPVFMVKAQVKSKQAIKDKHLKLKLSPVGQAQFVEAIWFNAMDRDSVISLKCEDEIEIAGVPEINQFRGMIKPTLRVRDFR